MADIARAGWNPTYAALQFKKTLASAGGERATCIHCCPDTANVVDADDPANKGMVCRGNGSTSPT